MQYVNVGIVGGLTFTGVGAIVAGGHLVGCVILAFALALAGATIPLTKLARAHRRLRRIEKLVKNSDTILITTDSRGIIDGFNEAAEESLGYRASEVIGKVSVQRMHASGDLTIDDLYGGRSGDTHQQELLYVRNDGSQFPALVTTGEIRDSAGRRKGYFGFGINIEMQKSAEAALREKQELIESIAATSPTIFYTFDLNERKIVYCNRELPGFLGYSEEQSRQMGPDPLPSLIHPEDIDVLFNRYQHCRRLKDGQVLEIEFRCLAANGELRWVLARDVVFKRDSNGTPSQILVNLMDATERKMLSDQIENQVLEIHDTNLALEIQTNALAEANAQLESLAFTDGLTGIANHRSFQEELAKAFSGAKPKKKRLSLMLIDVDKFKQYNDTYGHPSGDIVLKWVAAAIRDCSPQGCVPARYGGEEFAVLCPGFDAMDVLTLAEKIRSAIEETPWPERLVTVSIGAVTLCDRFEMPSEFVTAADTALYSSKASGRNCVTLYDYGNRTRLAG